VEAGAPEVGEGDDPQPAARTTSARHAGRAATGRAHTLCT
jgi:hypothetical protein